MSAKSSPGTPTKKAVEYVEQALRSDAKHVSTPPAAACQHFSWSATCSVVRLLAPEKNPRARTL